MTQEQFFSRYKYDRIKDRVGGGGFGNVYKVFDTIENETVALKIAEVKQGQESLSLLKEVELASSLKRHVNIARYTACYRFDLPNGHFDFGILQYYPLGNLSQLVKSKKLTHIEKEQIAKGVISGIQHLHTNNIVHRDLKSANILIAEGYQGEYVPKIADFGLSKQFAPKDNSYFSNSFAGGSLLYIAPEQLEGKELRKNVDLWSLGVVLYELFVGETPFKANVDDGSETARSEILNKIREARIPTVINMIPSPWKDIIKSCLVVDPVNRIKRIEEVVAKIEMRVVASDNASTKIEVANPIIKKPIAKESINATQIQKSDENEESTSGWLIMVLIGAVLAVVVWMFLPSRSSLIKDDGNIGPNKTVGELKEVTENVYENENSSAEKVALKIASNMVRIPEGTFIMGCMDEQGNECDKGEKPSHKVTVSGFSINKYEVTQNEYDAIMSKNPSEFINCESCPVENVSWVDVQNFIKKLNQISGKKYRLPSEKEWEYAARGGQNYKFSGSNNIDGVAWYLYNSHSKTHSVGLKQPNFFGLYDMSGNVWEWCYDWFKGYPGSIDVPDHTGTFRVMRGGSWKSHTCRTTDRNLSYPSVRYHYLGFRLASTK